MAREGIWIEKRKSRGGKVGEIKEEGRDWGEIERIDFQLKIYNLTCSATALLKKCMRSVVRNTFTKICPYRNRCGCS